jgi:NADPH-dependent curcumin reductase CurA
MANRQVLLAQRPIGVIDATTTSLVETPIPVCGPGEALIKVGTLSIDPAIRGWMNDAPGYLPPIGVGEVIRSSGVGEAVESQSLYYKVGDKVFGFTNWQEWVIANDENKLSVLPTGMGLDLATVVNVIGVTGVMAFFGLTEIGQFKAGDVVVVSGAAGATGSTVGQIAKAHGAAKVVGIAGGPEKCAEVVEKFGFDECLDYREPHLTRRLRTACPNGVDLYFDNVGGEILDAVLTNIAMRARGLVRGDLAVQQHREAVRTDQYVDADRASWSRGGFHHPRLRVALRRGPDRAGDDGAERNIGPRGAPGARTRTRARGAEPVVHRRKPRQDVGRCRRHCEA